MGSGWEQQWGCAGLRGCAWVGGVCIYMYVCVNRAPWVCTGGLCVYTCVCA